MAPLDLNSFADASHTRRRSFADQFEAQSTDSLDTTEDSTDHFEDDELESDQADVTETLSPLLLTSGHFEQALHPLRVAADRVGREVEKFAEKLDTLNPLRQRGPLQKYDVVFELLDSYRTIADDAVKRLQKRHASEYEQAIKIRWQRRAYSLSLGLSGGDSESDDRVDRTNRDAGFGEQTTVRDLEYWRLETQTWELLKSVLMFQYPRPNHDASKAKADSLSSIGHVNKYSSEGKIWKRFLAEDDLARERQTILKWLRSTAESSGKDVDIITEELETGGPRGKSLWRTGWLYTKEAIKAQKRLRSWPQALDPDSPGLQSTLRNSDNTEGLVTQLDPDAVNRQGLALEKQDQYFERATWLVCWEMIKRGKSWNQIHEWCQDRVDGWRIASIGGAEPTWDSSLEDDYGEDPSHHSSSLPSNASSSNTSTSRALWRRMCFAAARSGHIAEHESAVYGFLGGDVQTVERVCQSWDEFLFAHYNSLLLSQFDHYLRSNYPDRLSTVVAHKFGVFDSVQYHGEPDLVSRRLVDRLKSHEITSAEAQQPIKLIQSEIIAKTFKDFLYRQGIALSKIANAEAKSKIIPSADGIELEDSVTAYISPSDYDALRVITHMLLIFQDLGMDIGQDWSQAAIENILVAYIDFLRLAGKSEMIPLYASRLSQERSTMVLGRVLIDITDPRERNQQISLMAELGIDVTAVLTMQLEFISQDRKLNEPEHQKPVTIEFLETAEDPNQIGKQVKEGFMREQLSVEEDLLVRAFEWFILLDGHWVETFAFGAKLYKSFLRSGRLAAAKQLSMRMPYSAISLAKTKALWGKAIDISQGFEDSEDESGNDGFGESRLTRSRSQEASRIKRSRSSIKRAKRRREALLDLSRTYLGLEQLVLALEAFEKWRDVLNQVPGHNNPRFSKQWRSHLQKALDEVSLTVEPLLHDWLTKPVDDAEAIELAEIRKSYIPEVVLAYIGTLHAAGHYLRREYFLDCMDLSTTIADQGSNLAECFVATGRMGELVEYFAITSKTILKANESGGAKRGKSKNVSKQGGNLSIWHVKI
ncbi:MAG: hypothetical protein M1819_000099 [Sarea resinae]|nr:MAG: hypothetical protein M1819_000099 [Sarea resinae]